MPYKVLYSSSKLRQTQKRGVCHVLSLFIFADYPREIKFIVHVFYANLTYQDGNQKPIEVKQNVFAQSFICKVKRTPGMRIGLTDYDDEILVTGMALELLLLEDPSDFSEKTPVILLISNFDGRIDQIKHSVNNYIDKCHGGQKNFIQMSGVHKYR